MKRLWRRLDKLETHSGFDHFALESDGWVFMYQGGDLLVAPSPMSTEEWVAERERENVELVGPPEDLRVTPEEAGPDANNLVSSLSCPTRSPAPPP